MEKKRVLMLLSNSFAHDPRVYMEAKTLVKNGYSVTVLAWDRKKRERPFEDKDGIKVVRSYNTKFMDILPYDIFRLHFWWRKGYKDSLEIYKNDPFDIIHCHDLDTLPIGVRLKKKLNLPLIYDAHEIWGYMVSRDLPKIWAHYYIRKEKILVKYVDHIITVNEPLKEYFEKIINRPITVVMNAKPLLSKKYEPPNNKTFTVVYIGTIGKPRFLLELVDIVKELNGVYCIIAGCGSDKRYIDTLKNKCFKVQNVDFLGCIPMEKVLNLTKSADVVIHMVNPEDPNNRIGLGNKQFEALVSGRPIISTRGTYAGEFTEKEKCGLVVPYEKDALKKAIIKLRDDPKLREELGKNALRAAIEKYNWDIQGKKLVMVYESFSKK